MSWRRKVMWHSQPVIARDVSHCCADRMPAPAADDQKTHHKMFEMARELVQFHKDCNHPKSDQI